MKHVMDLPCFREAELVSDGGEDFDNCERSFSLQGELWVGNGTFEISDFQPDFVTFGKGSEASIVM